MSSHDEKTQGLASKVAKVMLLAAHVADREGSDVGLVADRVRLVLAIDHQDTAFAS